MCHGLVKDWGRKSLQFQNEPVKKHNRTKEVKLLNATKQFTLSTPVIKKFNETLPYYTHMHNKIPTADTLFKTLALPILQVVNEIPFSAMIFFFLLAVFPPISPLYLFIEVSCLGVQGQ